MATVHKVHKKETQEKEKQAETKPEETKTTPVVVLDTVTETTERIEVIEQVAPQETKSKEKAPPIDPAPAEAPSAASSDPLTEFKEKMTEEEYPNSDMPPKKNFMWPILFIFIIALLMLIGIFVYKQGMNKGTQVNVVTLSPTPTVIPQPTKAVDLTQYEIKVLNGSEVGGEAGRQKESLETEGFTISSVGNADNSDYTRTIIQAKENVDSAFLDKLKSVLEESFVVGESEELPEDADSDVIVILGSETN